MKKTLTILTVLLLPLLVGATIAFNPPTYELQGHTSQSIQFDTQNAYSVESFTTTDHSRPTPPMEDFEGSNSRVFNGKIWRPELTPNMPAKKTPLVIYSHGFMSFHEESDYLGAFLAERGYTMVAFDYPATHFNAPGGPNLKDLANQPKDISAIIDYFESRNQNPEDRLYQQINLDQIALAGLSLGGLTTTLSTFHKELRDDRISAAISIAGPVAFFQKTFFETTDTPFLYIAGEIDAMVSYKANAVNLKDKVSNATIVTIEQGSHTGFADIAEKIFRWIDNPDDVGCSFLLDNIPQSEVNPFAVLGGSEVGISFEGVERMPCQNMPLPTAMDPRKQLVLTKMAVYAFLQSEFANTVDAESHRNFLRSTFPQENDSIRIR